MIWLARLAMRYRRDNQRLRKALVLCQAELHRVRTTNHQLSATLARMDATNAQLAHTSAAADFKPPGRFAPWTAGEPVSTVGQVRTHHDRGDQ